VEPGSLRHGDDSFGFHRPGDVLIAVWMIGCVDGCNGMDVKAAMDQRAPSVLPECSWMPSIPAAMLSHDAHPRPNRDLRPAVWVVLQATFISLTNTPTNARAPGIEFCLASGGMTGMGGRDEVSGDLGGVVGGVETTPDDVGGEVTGSATLALSLQPVSITAHTLAIPAATVNRSIRPPRVPTKWGPNYRSRRASTSPPSGSVDNSRAPALGARWSTAFDTQAAMPRCPLLTCDNAESSVDVTVGTCGLTNVARRVTPRYSSYRGVVHPQVVVRQGQ